MRFDIAVYAHDVSLCLSVCPSVCHNPVLYQNGEITKLTSYDRGSSFTKQISRGNSDRITPQRER